MPETPPPPQAIAIHDLHKRYATGLIHSAKALDGVSLSVSPGEIFGFLGPNGAGKTSLIKILVGIMRPDKGNCRIFDVDSTQKDAKLRLGYLPERPYFHDFLTAEEFLLFHGRLVGLSKAEILDRIPLLLKRVGLAHARHQKIRTFSKGMLQRIGLAQALLHNPDILILDEPMSGLDPVGRREVRDIIVEIAESGKTIFFSTHIIFDVEVICTNVGFIRGGKLIGSGNIEQLLGKTVKSIELRFRLDKHVDFERSALLRGTKKTMSGFVVELEGDENELEGRLNDCLREIHSSGGIVQSVVPRKNTLEDLFFTNESSR